MATKRTSKKADGDITELKSFPTPPAIVKDVLTAALFLLGHTHKEAQDWAFIKKMLGKSGKDNLAARTQDLDPSTVTPEAREKCRALLKEKGITIEKAENASRAVGKLLKWELSIVGPVSTGETKATT